MSERLRPRITFANVVSCLALFVALGSGAYAAVKLPKNSVGSKQIRKNAVKTGDIDRNAVKVGKLDKEAVKAGKLAKNAVATNRLRDNAVTGAKVKESTLGTVPRASAASRADSAGMAQVAGTAGYANAAGAATVASALTPSEDWHEVGSPGEPPLLNGWLNAISDNYQGAAFYKDHDGIVHLRGLVEGGSGPIFILPPGYRPTPGKVALFAVRCSGGSCGTGNTGVAWVYGSGYDAYSNSIYVEATSTSLDGISFRAES